MVKNYIPDRGDIVYTNFNPQSGKEQAGKRPALVISPKSYNGKIGLALLSPITSHKKGYLFETELPNNLRTKGVILSDQTKSFDWQTRKVRFVEKLPTPILEEALYKLKVLLD